MRMAWMVVVLLFPVALLNYLDRQMISSMKTSVMSDISGLASESQSGYMLGQFKWSYAFFSPIGGLLADRVNRSLYPNMPSPQELRQSLPQRRTISQQDKPSCLATSKTCYKNYRYR